MLRKALCGIIFAFSVMAADFSVPFMKKSPVIDGRLEQGEWDPAMAVSGSAKNMDARRTTMWMGYGTDALYIALQAEMPPRGNLVAGHRWINHDDSLELWFAPPANLRVVDSLKFGAFQIIVNSKEQFLAEHHNPGFGLGSVQWKHNAKIKSSVEDGLWTLELAFPTKEMGVLDSPEGDWRILIVRNHGAAPTRVCPMTEMNDASSFEDPNSYSVFHFSKDCLAMQQLYAKGSRLPLLFKVVNNGAVSADAEFSLVLSDGKDLSFTKKFELAPGETATKDFTQDCGVEGAKCKITVSSRFWNKVATWVPPQPPIWRNTESYQTLFCGMDADADGFIDFATSDNAVAALKPDDHGKLPAVQGPTFSRRILNLTGHTLEFPKTKLQSPGAVSFWMRVDGPLAEGKEFRHFFGTIYKNSGYIYFYEQRQGGFLVGCKGFGPNNQKNMNTIIGRRPAPGQWMHVAFNFLPDHFEIYMNGIRRGIHQHNLDMDFSKAGGAQIANAAFADFAIYSRPLTAAEITRLAQGDKVVTGTVSWYQSLNKVVVDMILDGKAVPEKKLELQIRNGADKTLERFPLDFNAGFKRIYGGNETAILHTALPLSQKLEDGKYLFTVTKPESDNPLYEREFTVKDYEWLNNDIGKTDRLITGFTPIKRKGDTLSAVLKEMTLADGGLPKSVVANGEEVLARPVAVVAEASGNPLAWRCKAPTFTGESDTVITAESELECDAMKIHANIRMEQDGMLRYDWKLTRQGSNPLPTRLYVDIPVRKEVATLYHPVGERLRHNPAGFIPKVNGVVFSSRSIPQPNFDSFLPYIWVGDDYRGICYAADWDKGWCHTQERDGVELIREEDGTIVIRLNFLNEPQKLLNDNTITFALLASPVKPMPNGWRGWRDQFTKKGTQVSRAMYSNPIWGCYTWWPARYPAFEDYTVWDKMMETRRTGVIDEQYLKSFVDRLMDVFGTGETGWVNSMSRKEARAFFDREIHSGFRTAAGLHGVDEDNGFMYCYTCNNDSTAKLPEHPVMRDEWKGGQMLNDSYVDYALYYLIKMLEHGFKGIYNDNVFLAAGTSWVTNGAWIDDDGDVHPSMGLWRMREYNHRLAVALMEWGLKPWITVHHTNTNILVTNGLAMNTQGMEWKYGVNDFQERFTPDYMRTVCSGRQAGCFPTVLDGIKGAKTAEQRSWATRTELASLLPHEILPTCPRGSDYYLVKDILDRFYEFGTWKDDCVVYNYWDPYSPVKCSNDNLKQVTYVLGKEIFTFVGGFADADCTAEMDYGRAVVSARNDESGKPLEVSGGKVRFSLKKHDFVIIRATLE